MFDSRVVIVGGGPGGASCALALARTGFKRIHVLEAGNYSRFRIGESVPPEIRPLLRQLGVLEAFLREKHDPCHGSCSYWGNDLRGYNDSIMSVYGHGWHLNRQRFDRFLASEAQKVGVVLEEGYRFVASEAHRKGGYRIRARRSGDEGADRSLVLDADFVVDASGGSSVFARERGAVRMEDRPLICTGKRFRHGAETPITGLTHLEAVSHGWWYAARLPEGQMLLTLTTDAETHKSMGLHREEAFQEALLASPNTARLLKDTTAIDREPRCYPAPSYRMSQLAGKDWLALGDAAIAFDPITAQGIIKAINHGIFAAKAIELLCQGNAEAPAQYAEALGHAYAQYQEMRQYLYDQEQRFPQSSFWRHMQEREVPALA